MCFMSQYLAFPKITAKIRNIFHFLGLIYGIRSQIYYDPPHAATQHPAIAQ